MRIVAGCDVDRHIRTHHVSVILMHRCTYWKRLVLVVIRSANTRIALQDATEIVEGELGKGVVLYRIFTTRIQPRTEEISYPVVVLGHGPREKNRKKTPRPP